MNSTEGGATPIPARTWPALIGDLIAGRHLTGADASAAMEMILTDQATSSQIAGFVVALRAKGETSEELSGLLDAVLAQAAIVPLDDDERARAIDVVGTGQVASGDQIADEGRPGTCGNGRHALGRGHRR